MDFAGSVTRRKFSSTLKTTNLHPDGACLQVNYIANTIGRALNLNSDLIEAIALGHDLGHSPFGTPVKNPGRMLEESGPGPAVSSMSAWSACH
jgi:hypothetical protein